MTGAHIKCRLTDDDSNIITLQHTVAIFLVTSWQMQQISLPDSMHWLADTTLQVIMVRESVAMQRYLLLLSLAQAAHSTIRTPSIPEDLGHLLGSRANCLKYLGPRTSVMLPLHGLPFLFKVEWLPQGKQMKDSLHNHQFPSSDNLLRSVQESVHTIWRTGLLQPSESYHRDGNSVPTSVGSM
jgi:hypothetical protein